MFCKFCGAEVNENDTFCNTCGKRINGEENTFYGNTTKDIPVYKKWWFWVIIAVAAVIVLFNATLITSVLPKLASVKDKNSYNTSSLFPEEDFDEFFDEYTNPFEFFENFNK